MSFRAKVLLALFAGFLAGAFFVFTPAAPNLGGFGGFQAFAQQVQPIGPYGNIPWIASNTATDTATLSASQMTGILVGTPTAAATYTTDTAANLCALFPFVANSAANSFNWSWVVKNTSAGANTITVAAGTGVTVSGTATAAQNNLRRFQIVLNECRAGKTAAATVYSLETAAY